MLPDDRRLGAARLLGLVAGLIGALLPCQARADVVRLRSGRTIAIRSLVSDSTTGRTILQLRGGGEVECETTLIVDVVAEDATTAASDPSTAPTTHPPGVVQEPNLGHLPFGAVVARVALAHGLRPSLIHAVIQIESGHNQSARSPKGAVGLMQLMPATAVAYGLGQVESPEGNIEAGVRHLRDFLSRHSLPLALAAYNAGEGAVQRYGGIPPFGETRSYVERVLIAFQRLSGFLPSRSTGVGDAGSSGQTSHDNVQALGVSSKGSGDSAIIAQ